MECFDFSDFVPPLIWSTTMVMLIAKLDRFNGYESGLKALFRPPFYLALFLSVIYMLVFYEALPSPENLTLGDIANNVTRPLSTITCRFLFLLEVLSPVLTVAAFYKLLEKWMPNEIRHIKDKIKSLFLE